QSATASVTRADESADPSNTIHDSIALSTFEVNTWVDRERVGDVNRAVDVNEVTNLALGFRNGMTDRLIAGGMIRSAGLEAAFRTVPRELFTPAGIPLDAVYDPDQSVVTKTDAAGAALSSVSAPAIQALMIEQAEIASGMTVLEVGSG